MPKYNFTSTKITTTIPKQTEPDSPMLRFSFKFYDPKHATSKKVTFNNKYPALFSSKLKEFEGWTVRQFIQTQDDNHRIHPIKWADKKVAFNSFGLKSEYDESAWQFSISTSKYGRVHGFLIYDTFHVVWLDPQHKVYPRA